MTVTQPPGLSMSSRCGSGGATIQPALALSPGQPASNAGHLPRACRAPGRGRATGNCRLHFDRHRHRAGNRGHGGPTAAGQIHHRPERIGPSPVIARRTPGKLQGAERVKESPVLCAEFVLEKPGPAHGFDHGDGPGFIDLCLGRTPVTPGFEPTTGDRPGSKGPTDRHVHPPVGLSTL